MGQDHGLGLPSAWDFCGVCSLGDKDGDPQGGRGWRGARGQEPEHRQPGRGGLAPRTPALSLCASLAPGGRGPGPLVQVASCEWGGTLRSLLHPPLGVLPRLLPKQTGNARQSPCTRGRGKAPPGVPELPAQQGFCGLGKALPLGGSQSPAL